ncbi:MAG TPA: DNA translocase FtsK 4TM domain-containing protein [Candidatus Saccharibacteria bacterium]|nr:DNA translocase FtsK 4TM domain-containing protein [Candidatus Saccharibacteria bacterium]
MAKRKKRSSKKKAADKAQLKAQHILPDGWWQQVVSIIIGLTALLLTLAIFNLAGPMPSGMLSAMRTLFGYSAFVLPLVLFVLMFQKFITEDNRLALSVYFGSVIFMTSLSSFIHLFVDPSISATTVDAGRGGGMVGATLDQFFLGFLSNIAAGVVLFALILLSVLFIFKIPVKDVFKAFFGIFKSEDNTAESEEKSMSGLKLNRGVMIDEEQEVDGKENQKPRLSSLRNSVAQDKVAESKDALTVASDPNWNLPGVDLLSNKQSKADPGDIKHNAQLIKNTLQDFKINVEMEEANIGPKVTQYTLKPPAGVKLNKISSLDGNLALSLGAEAIRIEAPIPGKHAVGVEVPNKRAATVNLRSIIETQSWTANSSPLGFAIGKDISGLPVLGELEAMPHLLIAGQTGSGKSVMINTLLASLLYRNSPADLKLILVDPKQVELTPYNHIPHLLTPVITEPEKTISALKWAVNEMERRYTLLANKKQRNIAGYNAANKDDHMPYVVIVIDELADLMMLAARDVEALIVRIAQKARAVGIHLVLATQRPSVDVITGLIKANIPARIAFTVASQVDSRTIIDQMGAEKLLGKGDLLMTTAAHPKPRRVQGVFVDDHEVLKITDFIKMQREPDYNDEVVSQQVQISAKGGLVMDMDTSPADDELYQDAVRCVIESGKASASLLQRRLRVGYGRASRLIDTMEEQGIIGPADGARPRDVLVSSLEEVFGSEDTTIAIEVESE